MGFRLCRSSLLIAAFLTVLGPGVEARASAGDVGAQEVTRMVNTLALSTSGKKLLDRAVRFWGLKDWKELPQRVSLGRVSRTDAVLTRHFDTTTGEERRERKVTITIRAAQPFGERVLDFAHELTHAIEEPSWDPYDPGLTPARYIHASLESKGGEVEAVTMECEVARELLELGQPLSTRCDRYFPETSETGAVDRTLIQKDFYRVGKWKEDVLRKLGADSSLFPHLSAHPPELYSATGGAPYPVSLLKEYEELNRIACQNARRRVDSGRSPAAVSAGALIQSRCQASDAASAVARSETQEKPLSP